MLKGLTFINMVGFPVSEYVGDSKKGLLFSMSENGGNKFDLKCGLVNQGSLHFWKKLLSFFIWNTLHEKCPKKEFFPTPHFPTFGLNTVRYSVFPVFELNTERYLFSPNAGKCGQEKTPHLDTFRAVIFTKLTS